MKLSYNTAQREKQNLELSSKQESPTMLRKRTSKHRITLPTSSACKAADVSRTQSLSLSLSMSLFPIISRALLDLFVQRGGGLSPTAGTWKSVGCQNT
mmetsp:Transcript_62716/g.97650  ORF Transcript_62716/g.97650 Transcript_62716/m.97650 type:complete len:98 (+) Transcript_62716:90-383(+)